MAAERNARRKFVLHNLPERYFKWFAKMRSEKQLCDISISAGNVKISAHRLILGAVIPYFADRLSEDSVILDDVEPSAVACLIDYAYTSEVNIDTTNVKNLLVAACLFGIDEVKKACCDFLSDGLEPETARNVRDLANKLNCWTLWKKADSYMTENFNAISQSSDFLDFSPLDLEGLTDRDDLNVKDEEKVLDAVLRWVKKSPKDRTGDLLRLLCTVRLTLIQPQYLEVILQNEYLIGNISSCRKLVEDAQNYNFYPGRKAVWHLKTQPRQKKNYAREILCIYRLEVKNVHTIQRYDLLGNKFFTETRRFLDHLGSTVHFKKKIYYFYLCTTMQYDPKNDSMMSMCRMPTLRDFVGATVVKDRIYICGGRVVASVFPQSHHEITCTNVVECFDPVADTWSAVKRMPTRRGGLSAVTLYECIFTIGGTCIPNAVNTVEMYDPEHDRWTRKTPMLNQRYNAGATALNGRIYVCGGISSDGLSSDSLTTSCEMYDPVVNNWVKISPISDSRYCFVLLPFQEKLYAFGGWDSNYETIYTVGVYDPETDTWTSSRPKNIDFFTSGAVVMDAVGLLPEIVRYRIA